MFTGGTIWILTHGHRVPIFSHGPKRWTISFCIPKGQLSLPFDLLNSGDLKMFNFCMGPKPRKTEPEDDESYSEDEPGGTCFVVALQLETCPVLPCKQANIGQPVFCFHQSFHGFPFYNSWVLFSPLFPFHVCSFFSAGSALCFLLHFDLRAWTFFRPRASAPKFSR